MRQNLTSYQKTMLYGEFGRTVKPESLNKNTKGVNQAKVEKRRRIEEIREQRQLNRQFDDFGDL